MDAINVLTQSGVLIEKRRQDPLQVSTVLVKHHISDCVTAVE